MIEIPSSEPDEIKNPQPVPDEINIDKNPIRKVPEEITATPEKIKKLQELSKESRDAYFDSIMEEKFRVQELSNIRSEQIINNIRYWHDEFKPDYIFLTETSAFPAGYAFKEAWKTAFPGETPPKFFRIDPKAMGLKSNAKDFPEYERVLENFLRERISTDNPRVIIYDEQPVTRASQQTIKNEMARKLNLPSKNIEISFASSIISDEFIASDAGPGLRLTEKYGKASESVVYKKPEEIKFTGKIRPVKSGRVKKDLEDQWRGWGGEKKTVNLLDVIHDLKLAGKRAGVQMVRLMEADPKMYAKTAQEYNEQINLYREAWERDEEDQKIVHGLKEKYGLEIVASSEPWIISYIREIRRNFGGLENVRGKRILDLGCGSTLDEETKQIIKASGGKLDLVEEDLRSKGKLDVARYFVFQPWICRILLELGANPVGVDVGSNQDEKFENYQLDLSQKGALDFLPDKSFDGFNLKSLLDSPQLGMSKSKKEREAMKLEIERQRKRLLKDDGKVIYLDEDY